MTDDRSWFVWSVSKNCAFGPFSVLKREKWNHGVKGFLADEFGTHSAIAADVGCISLSDLERDGRTPEMRDYIVLSPERLASDLADLRAYSASEQAKARRGVVFGKRSVGPQQNPDIIDGEFVEVTD